MLVHFPICTTGYNESLQHPTRTNEVHIKGKHMKLALFDLDHTLLDVDSDYLWGEYVVRNGLVDETVFRAKNKAFYEQYIAGTLDAREYNEFVASFLSQHTLTDLHAWRADYIATDILPNIRPQGVATLKKHLAEGHDVVIISATNEFIVHAIAAEFGIETDRVIATTLEKNDRGYTGKVLGTPNFQAGKIANLQAWLADKPAVTESWGYSDSINDLPLLEFANTAFAVTPDAKLLAHATSSGWQVLDWSLSS